MYSNLYKGKRRYSQLRAHDLPIHGSWEVAVKVFGNTAGVKHLPNRDFMNLIRMSNQEYTGWPLWQDLSGAEGAYQNIGNKSWEAYLYSQSEMFRNYVDCWIINPLGEFYHYRSLEDDFPRSKVPAEPFKYLDYLMVLKNVGQAILQGLHLARAMKFEENSLVSFNFRWNRLRNRTLFPWSDPGAYVSLSLKSNQDICESEIEIPISTSNKSIARYV